MSSPRQRRARRRKKARRKERERARAADAARMLTRPGPVYLFTGADNASEPLKQIADYMARAASRPLHVVRVLPIPVGVEVRLLADPDADLASGPKGR